MFRRAGAVGRIQPAKAGSSAATTRAISSSSAASAARRHRARAPRGWRAAHGRRPSCAGRRRSRRDGSPPCSRPPRRSPPSRRGCPDRRRRPGRGARRVRPGDPAGMAVSSCVRTTTDKIGTPPPVTAAGRCGSLTRSLQWSGPKPRPRPVAPTVHEADKWRGRRERPTNRYFIVFCPTGQDEPGSFEGSMGLGFVHRRPGGAQSSCRRNIAAGNQLKGRRKKRPGATTRAFGFVCRVSGSFVGILGSFVDFLGFRGFVRGFVRRKKGEKYRFMRHKER